MIRHAKLEDVETLHKLEQLGFPKEEAATLESLQQRVSIASDTFWVYEKEGTIMSYIDGIFCESRTIVDAMFEDISNYHNGGNTLAIFGVVTKPSDQGKGYASKLMYHVIEESRRKHKAFITLTCKAQLIKFYESFGFELIGESESTHGGALWYDMGKPLNEEE